MKKILVTLLTLGMLFSAFGSAVSAADAKKVIKVYNWGEYISDGADDTLDVIAEFETRFPGYDVEYTTFATNEEMYAKIASGSANYDVIIPSDYMISRMIKEDMLAELDFNNIPNYSNIDDNFKSLEFDPDNKFSVPYTWGTVGIVYNTKKVTEPITSWKILWDEKYKGDILMFDNSRDSYGIAQKVLGISQNTTDKSEIDQATKLLREQKDVLQAYVMDEIFSKMPNGEAAMAPYYAGDAITMINDNPDLAFVIPQEGTNRFVDSMVVPKNADNKEGAEKFINYMLELDVAQANIEYIGYSTPISAVRDALDDELKNSPIAYPSDEILAKCETFINLPDEINTYMQDGWVDVKASGGNNAGAIVFLCIIIVLIAGIAVMLIMKKRRNR